MNAPCRRNATVAGARLLVIAIDREPSTAGPVQTGIGPGAVVAVVARPSIVDVPALSGGGIATIVGARVDVVAHDGGSRLAHLIMARLRTIAGVAVVAVGIDGARVAPSLLSIGPAITVVVDAVQTGARHAPDFGRAGMDIRVAIVTIPAGADFGRVSVLVDIEFLAPAHALDASMRGGTGIAIIAGGRGVGLFVRCAVAIVVEKIAPLVRSRIDAIVLVVAVVPAATGISMAISVSIGADLAALATLATLTGIAGMIAGTAVSRVALEIGADKSARRLALRAVRDKAHPLRKLHAVSGLEPLANPRPAHLGKQPRLAGRRGTHESHCPALRVGRGAGLLEDIDRWTRAISIGYQDHLQPLERLPGTGREQPHRDHDRPGTVGAGIGGLCRHLSNHVRTDASGAIAP
jgi:hypothetical protein